MNQEWRENHRSFGLHHGIDGLFFDLCQVLASGRAGAALIDILPRASTGAGCLLGATAGVEVPADDCLLSKCEAIERWSVLWGESRVHADRLEDLVNGINPNSRGRVSNIEFF